MTNTHPTDTSEALREILAEIVGDRKALTDEYNMIPRGQFVLVSNMIRAGKDARILVSEALAAMYRTTHAGEGMVEASRLQAIIAELKSFPPSPLIEDAIDSLERIS